MNKALKNCTFFHQNAIKSNPNKANISIPKTRSVRRVRLTPCLYDLKNVAPSAKTECSHTAIDTMEKSIKEESLCVNALP